MVRPRSDVLELRTHLSGQSFVRIDGRNIYFGKKGHPITLARYSVFLSEYQANGRVVPAGFDPKQIDDRAALLLASAPIPDEHLESGEITVGHVTTAYRKHAESYYANDPQMRGKIERVTKDLDSKFGTCEASRFGPVKLEQLRSVWVQAGLSRPYVNSLTNLIFRLYKWAVSRELVEFDVYNSLKSLAPLRRGKTDAKETKPVEAVSIEDVRKTAVLLSPVLKAMIRVAVGTGLRPSELVSMTPDDIDRSNETWFYVPKKHKTMNQGKTRIIPIIDDVRSAIEGYLNRPSDTYLFSPKESVEWQNEQKRAARKTKVQPSQINRKKETTKRSPGLRYTRDSFRRAIARAANRAGVKAWHPYQLRHLSLEQIADALTIEHAQAIGGHSISSTTRIYAKVAKQKAIEAAKHAPKL